MEVRFENKAENQFEQYRSSSKQHLKVISCLLQQIQTRSNTNIIQQIWANIEEIQTQHNNQVQKLSKQLKKSTSFYLSIRQIQSQLKALAGNFCLILEQFPNRRIQSLYSQLLHISFRLKTIQPTSIHTHSTRMKQHLLDQLKDEKKKRNEMERQYMKMTEEFHKLGEQSANKLNEKQNEIQEYSKIENKFMELAQETNLLKDTNGKLKSMNENLKKEKNEIKNQLMNLKNTPCEECIEKGKVCEQLSLELKYANSQLETVNKQKNKLLENQKGLKSDVKSLREQVEELHKVRLDRQNTIVELEQQLSDTTKKLKQSVQNENFLRKKNDQLEKESDELNLQLRDHQREIDGLSGELSQSKKLGKQLQLERENFMLRCQELENKIEELEGQINEMVEMQDTSEDTIRRLTKQLEQREKNTNIHRDTAERLRKQLNQLKRRQDEIIEQKSDESEDDGFIKILSKQKQSKKHGVHNVGGRKKSGNKQDSSLDEISKRSNPEIEIVEDELLRMLLTQALSLESFLERD